MVQTMAFITTPRPLSLLASSTKDSWSSASVHCSYSKKSSRFSTNSKGLKRDGSEAKYDRESFSKLLFQVPISEMKFLSKLAFLCNIAYVIPKIEGIYLRRYYGLYLIASSLEAKAEATSSTKAKLEKFGSEKAMGFERKHHRIHSSKDLLLSMATHQSFHSSPFEWIICDDPISHSRIFVIQGPDSLISWWRVLFFHPTKVEGKLDVFVHKVMYEAAKVIHEKVIPHVVDFLQTRGEHARFQFTGHSLGGSIAVLVRLMLLIRNVVRCSMVEPVVTFGSPFVLCGGRKLLDELMLDDAQIYNVIMHRDIVPRGFSCNIPGFLISILKLFKRSLHSHPCPNENKFMYSPLGKLLILQPNAKSSPGHPLLPPGTAFYAFDTTGCKDTSNSAINGFLNSPHPLQTLFDPKAYGDDGTVSLNHDSSSYLKAINGVLRLHITAQSVPVLGFSKLNQWSNRSSH
ncbi:hypothetical protein J1N35_036874 [Gossypium stocksii]|uniref:Fungal lipase-type domain-containing protein n=1 Tax=Gossypium stocksii TaxID=47602 RepID=A0A9D3UIV8_9ROSI|nr:hypothetical protein J1N35_036874 [Gossypium stocksii]